MQWWCIVQRASPTSTCTHKSHTHTIVNLRSINDGQQSVWRSHKVTSWSSHDISTSPTDGWLPQRIDYTILQLWECCKTWFLLVTQCTRRKQAVARIAAIGRCCGVNIISGLLGSLVGHLWLCSTTLSSFLYKLILVRASTLKNKFYKV